MTIPDFLLPPIYIDIQAMGKEILFISYCSDRGVEHFFDSIDTKLTVIDFEKTAEIVSLDDESASVISKLEEIIERYSKKKQYPIPMKELVVIVVVSDDEYYNRAEKEIRTFLNNNGYEGWTRYWCVFVQTPFPLALNSPCNCGVAHKKSTWIIRDLPYSYVSVALLVYLLCEEKVLNPQSQYEILNERYFNRTFSLGLVDSLFYYSRFEKPKMNVKRETVVKNELDSLIKLIDNSNDSCIDYYTINDLPVIYTKRDGAFRVIWNSLTGKNTVPLTEKSTYGFDRKELFKTLEDVVMKSINQKWTFLEIHRFVHSLPCWILTDPYFEKELKMEKEKWKTESDKMKELPDPWDSFQRIVLKKKLIERVIDEIKVIKEESEQPKVQNDTKYVSEFGSRIIPSLAYLLNQTGLEKRRFIDKLNIGFTELCQREVRLANGDFVFTSNQDVIKINAARNIMINCIPSDTVYMVRWDEKNAP